MTLVEGRHFISYSGYDARDFAIKLHDALENGLTNGQPSGRPPIPVWLDKRRVRASRGEWDEQLARAIQTCKSLIFVMTRDSVQSQSICKLEWTHALKYKKQVIPLLLHPDAEVPFGLGRRHYIDFTGDNFDAALEELRGELQWLASSEGQLEALKDRLADAQRDLGRASDEQRARIQDDIDVLQEEIAHQQYVVDNPEEAERRVEESIERELEGEREPEKKPASGVSGPTVINTPPVATPRHFQDRHDETKEIGDLLEDDAVRLITVVGRGGIGKTAVVCRLLKSLEGGRLPDDGRRLSIDGIVYLRRVESPQANVPKLYADLCRLLPDAVAGELEKIYKDPQSGTQDKMRALLEAFPSGRYVLLLDNFENVVDPQTREVSDAELDEALRALLSVPHHAVKVIATTRFAPRGLTMVRPEHQVPFHLDEGLPSPYAENILRQLDAKGIYGVKTAPEELLNEARKRTGGNPRALEHLFGILRADRDTSLQEILDDIEGRLPEEDTEGLLPEDVAEVLVGEAFSRLDSLAQMVMQALAVYGRPVAPAAVDYLLQPHLSGMDSAPTLRRLVNMLFVRGGARRYHLHEVDRGYALSRVPWGEVADREETDAPPFTRFALLHRAADYFRQARTAQETWRTIEDLAPQLAEFDLRCAGQDYDTAASVLLEIDFDHLFLWGHSRLVAELHERLQGRLSDPQLKQESVGNLGTAYRNIGQVRKAITCHEWALTIARKIPDREGEGVWLGNLGLCYSDLGQTERAIEDHEQALDIAREIGDRRGEGNHLGNLGLCYSNLGQTERAIDYYEQARVIFLEIGDRRNEGAGLGNLGNCYSRLGQTERAMDHYQQALEVAREIGDREGEGNRLGNLGNRYADLGQTERAIEHHEQALEIAREIGAKELEGHELGKLGSRYSVLGQTERAMDHYEQALQIAREIGAKELEGWWLGGLGVCYSDLGQTERAIDYYQQALVISREIGAKELEGNTLGNLGTWYSNLGQIERAIDYYEQALVIFREIGDRRGEGTCLGNLGNCYSDLGQTERAMEHYEQALEIAREIGDRGGEAFRLGNIGEILIREGELGKAAQQYEAAIQIADEIGYSRAQNEARYDLALVYLYAGHLTAARAAAEAARQYDEPQNNANVRALLGVIALRQGDQNAAQEAFEAAVAQAEALLGHSERNYAALDSKGLALCGLVLCQENRDHIPTAIDAYRAARTINKDAGIVEDVLRLFDALAQVDPAGMLAEVRAAAAGE